MPHGQSLKGTAPNNGLEDRRAAGAARKGAGIETRTASKNQQHEHMDKQTAQRYADRIREQEDQATATLNMADHITGHYWVSLWCALDLARMAEEQGGTLTMYDGGTYTTADAIASMRKSLEGMRADLDALKAATQDKTNN